MTRRIRLLLFVVAALGTAVLLVRGYAALPPFGTGQHPYGDRAVQAAIHDRSTANAVSSVNFDQRALDTLGEEFIFFVSVVGAVVLLRQTREETAEESVEHERRRVLELTRVAGYLLLPVVLLVGVYIVAHGHLSPGGGFQGGVVLATGLHLLYLGGDYPALERLRPVGLFDIGEALAAGAFAVLALAGLAVAGVFLANFLPYGTFNQLASGGLVPVLNWVVGLEVGSGLVVLLAQFFEQALQIRPRRAGGRQ